MIKWLAKIFNRSPTTVRYELIQDKGNGYYQWGATFINRTSSAAASTPHVSAIGKLAPVHVKPEKAAGDYFYIKKVLQEPNPICQAVFCKKTCRAADAKPQRLCLYQP